MTTSPGVIPPKQLSGQPLIADRTIHVDSATGNDTTGTGSASLPFQTLARAWTERLTYGELRAKLVVQLHGVGPYTMPAMGASTCSLTGWFIVQGDPSVDVVNASGTFTADMNTTTCVVTASAGLGVDTWKGKTVRITSGNCNGTRCKINETTDTSITFMLSNFRTTNGAIVNGDTFQIVTPGTVIAVPVVTAASGQPYAGTMDWTGGGQLSFGLGSVGTYARHFFYNLSLTGGASTFLQFTRSTVGLVGVDSDVGFQCTSSNVAIGALANSNVLGIGADTATNLLAGCGVSVTRNMAVTGQLFCAGLYCAGFFSGPQTAGDAVYLNGARFDAAMFISGGRIGGWSAGVMRIGGTVNVQKGAQFVTDAGVWKFAVTSGDAVFAQQFSNVLFSFGTVSGGTTAAGGFGSHAVSGSRIVWLNKLPTLTGGTLNNDIKAESTAAIANATLSANGTSTLDAVTQAIVMRAAA